MLEMKKLISVVLLVAMVFALAVVVRANEMGSNNDGLSVNSAIPSIEMVNRVNFELQTVEGLTTGTYKVEITDNSKMGWINVYDNNGDVKNYIILADKAYGYIYIDSTDDTVNYIFDNVSFRLISEYDIGVSGLHVYDLCFTDVENDFN